MRNNIMNQKRLSLFRKLIIREGCLTSTVEEKYNDFLELDLVGSHSVEVVTTSYKGVINIQEETFELFWKEHKLKGQQIGNPFLKKVSFKSFDNKEKAIENIAEKNYEFFDKWCTKTILKK
jgi:hypothetical protein